MNIQLLENARETLAKAKTVELMISDINGIQGSGILYASSKSNSQHADPTFRALQSLEDLRKRLNAAQEQAVYAYQAAVNELESVHDEEMYQVLYLRYMKKFTWDQIARHFGDGFTGDAIKQKHSRFLRGQYKAGMRRC